jgi:carboxyl-terminal processing protease
MARVMLSALALLLPPAVAGDQALYGRAMDLIEERYLRPDAVSQAEMLVAAAEQLESKVEWLFADPTDDGVRLRDGPGDWTASFRLDAPTDLPATLARMEDAVRAAGRPIDADVDVRVEILRGVTRTLDRHSVVLHAEGLERFDERLTGTLTGVGATISTDDDGLFVREIVPDGPAARAGVQIDDRLVSIDGVSTVGMVPADATARIRGDAGSTVVLGVVRGEERRTIEIVRAEISIRNVDASAGPYGVGVVTIHHFSEQTRTWLLDALADLEARGLLERGLIIDLRGNTGGSLVQSAQAADTFLQAGLIVSTEGAGGAPVPSLVPRIEAKPDKSSYAFPIAVLMDHATASGSEILAGALGSLDRAVLVGTTSFGKGTVQKVYPLEPSIKLKLTVAEYLLEGRRRVAEVGLAPDLAIERVRIDREGVWMPDPARERRNHAPGTLTLQLPEGDEDSTLEVAAKVLSASAAPDRASVLAALQALAPTFASTSNDRLTEALAAQGLDWRPAPAPPPTAPVVDLRWAWSTPPAAGEETELTVTVTNRGPALHRAAIRLVSVNPTWDDALLPIGHLPEGATAVGRVRRTPPAGSVSRTDRVEVTLEADALAPSPLPALLLPTTGTGPRALAAIVRASPPKQDGRVRIRVDVRATDGGGVDGLEARLRFPDVDGLELVSAQAGPSRVDRGGGGRIDLALRTTSSWDGKHYPLELTLLDADVRAATWTLDLPRTGAPVRLQPPRVDVVAPPAVARPGAFELPVRAADDTALDHVVVYAGVETMNRARATPVVEHERDKVAWSAGDGRGAELRVSVPVAPGMNRYIVVAEDEAGLRTQRDLYVLGSDASVDVAVHPE